MSTSVVKVYCASALFWARLVSNLLGFSNTANE